MALDPDRVRSQLRSFIVKDLIRSPEYPLADGEKMISRGLMDSFALAELGVFVEETFGVYIPDPELTVERMDTLDQIVGRVLQG